jgi:hypothetical protein
MVDGVEAGGSRTAPTGGEMDIMECCFLTTACCLLTTGSLKMV